MTFLLVSLRRLRADRATALGLAMLIGVSGFVAALAPRVLGVVADEALRDELALTSVARRGLALSQEGQLGPSLGGVDAAGRAIALELPEVLQARLASPMVVIDSARWVAGSAVATPGTVRFRFQPGALSRVDFEAGRAPTEATTTSQTTRLGSDELIDLVRFEGALSGASADQLGVAVGDVITLAADPVDRLGRIGQGDVVAIVVTGIFTVDDPADPFWFDDPTLVAPTVRDVNANLSYVDATALLADEAYAPFMLRPSVAVTPLRYSWRRAAVIEGFDAPSARAVIAALRRVESRYPTVAVTFGDVSSSSDLRRTLEAQAGRWNVAVAILAILAIGTAFVAVAAVALVARMLGLRRAPGHRLSLGRGATMAQVLRSALAEGLILAAPAGALAALLAILVLPDGGLRASAVASAAVVASATVLVAVATLGALRGTAGGRSEAGDGALARDPTSARRRLVLEGFVVAIAVVGVVLLRSRGLGTGDAPAGAGGPLAGGAALAGPDPLLAAVPALVGVAAGIVAMRTFRLPLRALDVVAGLRRGLAAPLALRRLSRGSGAGPVLLVLLGTASIGAFSSALFAHVDRAAEAIAWNEVGAAYRVSGSVGRLPASFDPMALPGVTAAAGAYRGSVPIGDKGAQAEALVLDVAAYAEVVRGTPGEVGVPLEAIGPAGGQAGPPREAGDPLPIIISPALSEGTDGLAIGDPVGLSVAGVRIAGVVVAIRDDLPGLPAGGRSVVLARDAWPLATPPPVTTTVFVRAPDSARDALLAAVAAAVPGARTAVRADLAEAIRAAPVADAVRTGVLAALAVAAGYAALAVAVALSLTGAARAVESAHLRLLGLGPRDAVLLVVLEYGPLIGLAFVLGVGLGFGLFVLVRPALGLDVVVGSALVIPVSVSATDVVLSLAAIVAVAAIGIGVGALAERRAMGSGAIRLGIERP